MAERKTHDRTLVAIGQLLTEKRRALGRQYRARGKFIENRSAELYNGTPWISERHLANIEEGKNWISMEMLIKHAYALEMDPVELFREILAVYTGDFDKN